MPCGSFRGFVQDRRNRQYWIKAIKLWADEVQADRCHRQGFEGELLQAADAARANRLLLRPGSSNIVISFRVE
ncbi:hypothetical protein RHAB21_03865 [Pseudorhizobium halotolerans]|jgi:hypothetical protein|uniref:Uncharacterized protein n=1 Tax=Pseudorhizobium halotolerans TaxID=1233081 RepID=A0ABM8PTP8_9HYPH|nr:hypothetical protein RHAB21_03865 [Pseudorhizobium halotolerans]